jgi:intraflagellar transport protein 140
MTSEFTSLYFFQKLEDSAVAASVAAHRSLSLSCYAITNRVVIVGEDGESVATVQRTASNVSALAWHPKNPVLIIGWQDGNMSVWNQAGPEPQHNGANHHENSGIVAVCWTDNNVAATVSKTGAAVLWQYENPKLGVIGTSRLTSPSPIRSLTALHGTDEKPAEDNLFLAHAGGQEGYLIDESSQCQTAFQIDRDTTINDVLWSPVTRHVLVLSSNSTLYVYHVAHDNVFHSTQKQRLSIGATADAASATMIWAYPGIAAVVSGDDYVRFMNVEHEAMFMVQMPEMTDAKGEKPSSDAPNSKISAISSCRRKNLLAVGTKTGRVVVWNFSGTSASDDESVWSVVTSMDATHRFAVDRIHFTARGTMLITQGPITSLLQDTPRLRCHGHGAVAIQTSPDAAIIISTAGTSFTLRNNTRIKALDVAMPQVVVHTGKHLEVYALAEATGAVTQLHSVEQPSSVIAAHPESLLLSKGDKVSLQNLQLHQLQQVPFNEADGAPSLLNVMGDFAIVITAKNLMKVCRVSARDLRVIGPTRRIFSDEDSGKFQVTQAKINSRGKKVAFLRRPLPGGRPDSCVYVFDADTDVVSSFDFSSIGQIPMEVCWNRPASIGTPAGPGETESVLLAVETVPVRAGHDETGRNTDASLLEDEHAEQIGAHQRQVCTLFASPEGVRMHHHEALGKDIVASSGARSRTCCCAPPPAPTRSTTSSCSAASATSRACRPTTRSCARHSCSSHTARPSATWTRHTRSSRLSRTRPSGATSRACACRRGAWTSPRSASRT